MQLDAIKRPRSLPVDLTAALDASGVVGAWSWSARSDRCTLDAGAAEVLAGDPSLAGRPVPLETAKACVHPDDRPALFRHFRSLRERGGLFVAEYRTISPSGRVRRILDRGRVAGGGFEPAPWARDHHRRDRGHAGRRIGDRAADRSGRCAGRCRRSRHRLPGRARQRERSRVAASRRHAADEPRPDDRQDIHRLPPRALIVSAAPVRARRDLVGVRRAAYCTSTA